MRKKEVLLFSTILFVVLVFVIIYFIPIRFARHLKIQATEIVIDDYINSYVSLLCKGTAVTGSWFRAIGVVDNDKAYYFDLDNMKGYDLVTTGNDPWLILDEDLTLYNREGEFILTGKLQTNHINGVIIYTFTIDDWDIVYPIKSTLRPPFKWFYLSCSDY